MRTMDASSAPVEVRGESRQGHGEGVHGAVPGAH